MICSTEVKALPRVLIYTHTHTHTHTRTHSLRSALSSTVMTSDLGLVSLYPSSFFYLTDVFAIPIKWMCLFMLISSGKLCIGWISCPIFNNHQLNSAFYTFISPQWMQATLLLYSVLLLCRNVLDFTALNSSYISLYSYILLSSLFSSSLL